MKKNKSVDPSGKITITHTEERHPYSSEVLMRHGFIIIFLNMALGLLPVTIWGNRMKYFKCSISQIYTTLFCICFIILSVIFVPVVFIPKRDAEDSRSMTNLVILVAMGMVHVLGYIALLIRGHFVARTIPHIWGQLSKLVQIAILDVYGQKCHLFREVSSFTKWAVWEYLGIIFTTTGSSMVFSSEYADGLEDTKTYYKLNLYIWPTTGPLQAQDDSGYTTFQQWTFLVGYCIWQLCSSGHVLVTMFLCYIVMIITVCLKSVNAQIWEFVEKFSLTTSQRTCITRPKVRFDSDPKNIRSVFDRGLITERFDVITKVILITEEIIKTISLVWGISLIIETIILIAAGTVNAFDFLSMFKENKEEEEGNPSNNMVKFRWPSVDEFIGLFVTISTHFYFLFKLTSMVNKMIDEANKSLHLLKQTSNLSLPQSIREKISTLKQDLSSTNISLTASNFFQVNKFLITSITSQIATYVIVLLQFEQQEKQKKA